MSGLKNLLRDDKTTLAQVTAYLKPLSHEQKSNEALSLNKKCQARLWVLAKDGSPLDLNYLVPKDAKSLDPQPFDGKNSLPVFTRFQKVFYRTPDGLIGGYNNSSAAPLIGWGYYIAEPNPKTNKELAVNYTKLPKDKPAGWPAIKPNTAFPTIFVYGNMIDYLRRVDDEVLIGKAFRQGKEMENYFVLIRHAPRK